MKKYTARVARRKTPLVTSSTALTPVDLESSAVPSLPSLFSKLVIVYKNIEDVKPSPRRVRRGKKGQLEAFTSRLRRFGVHYPILIIDDGEIVDGHLLYEALLALDEKQIPTLTVTGLSDIEIRALRIWINRAAESTVWDPDAVKTELEAILAADPALVALAGFEGAEIDAIFRMPLLADPNESLAPAKGRPVTRVGDIWVFEGGHKILCANSRHGASYRALLVDEIVRMVCSDIPYGIIKIKGHVSRTHGEFVEGSGMTYDEANAFFAEFLIAMTPHLIDGAIVDLFIDAYGMLALLNALKAAQYDHKTICVWDKLAGGMGSLYRQQTEFVVVSKWGKAPHVNNISLGKHGRNRTTLWSYPGMAMQQAGRKEMLDLHPTVKPLALLSEAILDTSNRGDIILDPFAGSGSLMLAAHRVNRVARCIELDPKYVDVAVRRMEALTGQPARLQATGQTFAAVSEERRNSPDLSLNADEA